MSGVTLIVIAKQPLPGRVKTRLAPALGAAGAATVAEEALADTLAAVAATPTPRRILVLEGEAGAWLPDGFDVVPQRGGGLDARLAGAFAAAEGPALLVGMDTPQLQPADLATAIEALEAPGHDAVIGAAEDGGYWTIGLNEPSADAFIGVPMSTAWTARAQRARLRHLGLTWAELPTLRDIDTIDDARAVARLHPRTRFAAALAAIEAGGRNRATARVGGAWAPAP